MPVGQLPGLWVPDPWFDTSAPAFGSALVINAATQKAAMLGYVTWPGAKSGDTKNINKAGFRFGAVTNPALTTLRCSLQAVTTGTGFPAEIQDQSVTIPNGSIAANTWLEVTLGSSRTISPGVAFAVVWEYLNFVATASVVINTFGGQVSNQLCYAALKSGGGPTWATITALASVIPNVILGFDDGTYDTLRGAGAWKTFGTNSISSSLEAGNRITTGFPGIITDLWMFTSLGATGPSLLLDLYEALPDGTGETLVATTNAIYPTAHLFSNGRLLWAPLEYEWPMKPNRIYYVTMVQTGAGSLAALYDRQVNTAAYLAGLTGGVETVKVTRTTPGSGAWTVSTNTQVMCGIKCRGAQFPVRSAGMAV